MSTKMPLRQLFKMVSKLNLFTQIAVKISSAFYNNKTNSPERFLVLVVTACILCLMSVRLHLQRFHREVLLFTYDMIFLCQTNTVKAVMFFLIDLSKHSPWTLFGGVNLPPLLDWYADMIWCVTSLIKAIALNKSILCTWFANQLYKWPRLLYFTLLTTTSEKNGFTFL